MTSLSVANGVTVTTSTLIGGSDTVTVALGGVINLSTNSPDLNWDAASTGLTIDNDGTIEQTATGANARPAVGFSNVASLTGLVTIVNTGTISSTAAYGLLFGTAPGQEDITTSGSIVGGNGVAIQFGSGNDTLTLQSGYSITGRVDGGAGTNTLNLSGSAGGSFRGSSEGVNGTASTFAGFDKFNTLNVQSGAWSLYGGGYYDTINITPGATLIVVDHPTGITVPGNPSDGGVGALNSTLTLNNNGTLRLLNPAAPSTLVVDYDATHPENSATGPIVLAGTGGIEFSGYFVVEPNAAYTVASVTALDGTTLVLGTVNANLTVNSGAVVMISYGGGQMSNTHDGSTYTDTGTGAAVNGAIVDNGMLIVDRLDAYAFTGALTGNGILEKLGAGTLTLQGSTNFAGQIKANGGTLVLAGTIDFTGSNTPAAVIAFNQGGSTTINNTGTLISENSAAINMISAPNSVTVINSGTISGGTLLSVNNQGGVILSNHNDTLINTGVINGYVWLAGGTDTLDSHLGTINGTVITGVGSDTISLGAEDNVVAIGPGTHVVDGGGGANTAAYGGATTGVQVSLALPGQAQSTGVGTDTLSNFQNLIGSAHNDVLTVGPGISSLTGGLGADTFNVAASTADTTITDFTAAQGDRIDLAALGAFHSLADVLAASSQVGGDTVIYLGGGAVTLDNVSLAALTAGNFIFAIGGPDFNGDGFSDLIWQSKGTFAAWSLHDASIQAGISLGSAAGWQVQDVGDFSGVAGFSGDLLLRNTATGEVAVWTEANGTVSRNSLGVVPLAFRIVAAADFNGDGISDVLWRNEQSGGVLEWQMGPSGPSASYSLGAMSPDWKIVGAGDYNGDGKADILWRNAGDGEVAMWQTDGAGHVSASASLGVVPTPIQIVGSGDFNGDGKADILWRNANNGQMTIWEMNGAQVIGGAALYNPGTAWTVAGVEDVNGDGKADILLRNSSGLVVAWDMDGLAIDHSGVIGQVDPGWQIVNHHFETPLPPAADYNGDGKSDLIWQNNGTFAAWGLDDASVQSGASLGTAPGWQVQDLGDFSGAPGFSGDLLLRNTTTGAVAIWTDANGSVSQNSLGTVPLAFQIVAAADFNGDGTSDILWRNAQSGGVLVWQISGAAPAASYTLGSMPLDWNIVGAADYSGDGLADILWRNAGSGDVVMWQTDGAGHIASTTDLGAVPTAIQLVGSGDFNGDGKADILWRNANSGQLTIWEMNGGQLIGGGAIGNPGTAWTVAGVEDINGDGKADILLRNSSGLVAAWDMNGLAIDHSGTIAQLDPAWQLVNHDYHGF